MKKLAAFILALSLLLALCACGEQIPPIKEDPAPGESSPEAPDDSENYWEKNLPKMDGSTSLIPLEAGICSALFGISIEEATEQVSHTTTHDSFYNLLNGAADLIFSVPISEEQAKVAEEREIELEQVSVAKEGFVFVVNANNPVDGLTQKQLRDIYSGKITNWKEVGGNDEEIIAYQRNNDSGSQNYMTEFMGDTPLMDAPTTLRPASMSGLMDVIAVNDYAEQSIGYSVYAYAADMYGNGDEIKFLAIDGVEPSKVTMASGEYPLLSENYAIFRADEPADSPVRKLCDWIVSDEGQLAVAKAGYVTLRDIGFDYTELEASAAYSGVGSGYLETWDMPTWQCIAARSDGVDQSYSVLPLKITEPAVVNKITQYEKPTEYTTGITYELECLKDKELQNEINAFIAEAVKAADEKSVGLFDLLIKLNNGNDFHFSQVQDSDNGIHEYYPSAIVSVKAKNGYIWATVSQMYLLDRQDTYEKYYSTKCRTWDLFTGEELSVEDLFRKGLDVDGFLNEFLRKASQTALDSWHTYPQMKKDFARLPNYGWAISPEAIYIDYDNPYFAEGLKFSLESETGVLCSEVCRDMKGLFTESASTVFFLYEAPYKPVRTYMHEDDYTIQLLDETVGNPKARAKINADFLKKLEDITYENAAKYFQSEGFDIKAEDIYSWYSWHFNEYGERFAVFTSYGAIEIDVDYFPYTLSWEKSRNVYIYDLQTGEEITWEDLLIDGWEKSCKVVCHNTALDKVKFDGNFSNLPPFNNFSIYYGNDRLYPLTFHFTDWSYPDDKPYDYEIYLPLSALKIADELPK